MKSIIFIRRLPLLVFLVEVCTIYSNAISKKPQICREWKVMAVLAIMGYKK